MKQLAEKLNAGMQLLLGLDGGSENASGSRELVTPTLQQVFNVGVGELDQKQALMAVCPCH